MSAGSLAESVEEAGCVAIADAVRAGTVTAVVDCGGGARAYPER